jgi:hypothetical protein
VNSPWRGLWSSTIEAPAPYQPQQVCSPSPKPGVVAFRELVMRAYPDTADYGISRACGQGGRSEHKEGRAWDWGAAVANPQQKKEASEVIGWLLATDEYGNQYAMARRLGIMYIIYNGHIWSAYDAGQGWRPYHGPNAHTDHVHFSFDIDGGQGDTSFWRIDPLRRFGLGDFGPATILPEYDGPLAYGTTSHSTDPTEDSSSRGADHGATGGGTAPAPSSGPVTSGGGSPVPQSPGGSSGGGSHPAPAPAPPPSVPLTLPSIPVPTVPSVPGLPLCPAGTPIFPPPLDCVFPTHRSGG